MATCPAMRGVPDGSRKPQLAVFDFGEANSIFDESVRDGGSEPWRLLRDRLATNGYELLTADIADEAHVVYELHLGLKKGFGKPASLISMEPPQIMAKNYGKAVESRYEHIFTWHDGLAGQGKYVKSCFPNVIRPMAEDDPAGRDLFCCMIAGNKSLLHYDSRGLYGERVRAIRWFEKNAPTEFALYGTGWESPPQFPGKTGKALSIVLNVIYRLYGARPFSSYRGPVVRKADVLRRARFCICYENVRGLPGYITEKIFDCFTAGCVPVYWGANNITDYVPADCFIDRRKFASMYEIYRFMKQIPDAEYRAYQQRIADWLASEAVRKFTSRAFAERVASIVVQDLGRLA